MSERFADGRIITTDWEDVQYRFGNKVGQYVDHTGAILKQKESNDAENFAVFHRKSSLYDLSSDEELTEIRNKRKATLASRAPKFLHISETTYDDYIQNVTERSAQQQVLLIVYKFENTDCMHLMQILDAIAEDYMENTNLVRILLDNSGLQLSDTQLPCVVHYVNRAVVDTYFGNQTWGGSAISRKSVLCQCERIGIL